MRLILQDFHQNELKYVMVENIKHGVTASRKICEAASLQTLRRNSSDLKFSAVALVLRE